MAHDFSYGNSRISTTGPLQTAKKNAPNDVRTLVTNYSDIANIPNPYIGLVVRVLTDETNSNKMTDYIVTSLKANNLGVANTLVNTVQRYSEYLGVGSSTGGSTSVDLSNYYNKTEIDTKLSDITASNGLLLKTVDVTNDTFEIKKLGFILSKTSANINEGQSTSFTVKLEEPPTESVTVNLTSNNGNVTVSPNSLTFTQSNYNTPQTVTVTTVEALDFINWSGVITLSANGFNNSTFTVNCTNISINYGGSLDLSTSSITVLEGSATTFTVKLVSSPTQSQVVNLSSNNTDITLSPSSLTFNSSNYSTPQTITVSASEDSDETNDSATITISSTGLTSKSIAVTVTDNDQTLYGEINTSTSSLTIDEGSSKTFNVSLASQPTQDEVVTIITSDTDITTSLSSLTFSPSAYNTTQTVTVNVADKSGTDNWSGTLTLSSPNVTSKTVNVNVNNTTPIPLTGISIDTEASVMEGSTITLIPILTPSNANLNTELTWTVNNENATVVNGVITGVTQGTSIITVMSTNDNSISATCELTITQKEIIPTVFHFDAKSVDTSSVSDRNSLFVLHDVNGGDISLPTEADSYADNKKQALDIESHYDGSSFCIDQTAFTVPVDDFSTISPLFDDDFTIQINCKPDSTSQGNILWLGAYSNYTCCLSIRSNRIKLGDTDLNTSTITYDVQNQFIITYDKSENTMQIWVNGVKEYNSVLPRTLDVTSGFRLGTGRLGGNSKFYLYSIRIYNYIISDEEATSLYNSELSISGRE